MNFSKHRDEFLAWVKSQLTGPVHGTGEFITGMAPCDRYPTGTLAPVIKEMDGLDPASELQALELDTSHEDEDDSEEGNPSKPEPQQKKYRYMPPSSAGFSFFITGEDIEFQVQVFGARYEPQEDRDDRGRWTIQKWKRVELTTEDGDFFTFSRKLSPGARPHHPFRERHNVLKDQAQVDITCRPHHQGWILTVTLCNTQEIDLDGVKKSGPNSFQILKNSKTIFQARISVSLEKGEVGTYPRVDPSLLSQEEAELELQYRHQCIYAVGHGAAADWIEKNGQVREIRVNFIPRVEVPQVTADTGGDAALSLSFLAGFENDPSKRLLKLNDFISGYETWIEEQKKSADTLAGTEKEAALRIIQRMDSALARMEKGLFFLKNNTKAAAAFAIANQAMLSQMSQNDRTKGRKKPVEDYQWRPFQLAFFLMILESSASIDSIERDLVDLIWFPTGGGKTEAYLGVAAFVIALGRMTHPASSGGTAVIMRYTLRLLTAQQYLRATRLICAMELIRRRRDDLGEVPISIGMWVGTAISPNRISDAEELVTEAARANKKAPSSLVLMACPWCNTLFSAPENYQASASRFSFKCTNPECDLVKTNKGEGQIPCNVVDEALYDCPPTFLIATLDKFARLAWEPKTNAFFGGERNRPPELIIQDELHLISGALGSVAGIYEAGLHTILVHRGMMPKYIASTATIRMADDQVSRLYGADVAVFPPAGLSCDDAYFSKTVPLEQRPGRTFLGFMAPLLGRRQCMSPLVGTLLAGPEGTFTKGQVDRNLLLDAWWTLVVYHGSLKGVGTSHNLFNTGVRDFFRRLVDEVKESEKQNGSKKDENVISRQPNMLAQLTSIPTAEENAATFSKLERTREETGALDAVLATNMISVGLDVARLALMIINGQPLTTAEYIQASSRVGRDRVPGIVFTNYYRDQARSLSHYENFRAFHESFYRFVEPTSITPFTFQARRRALHAALIIALRHADPNLLANVSAGHFNPDKPETAKIIQRLKHRCAKADPERSDEIKAHIDNLVKEWIQETERCKTCRRRLVYWAPGNTINDDRLIHNHHDKVKGLWPTLQSMRNVENTALLKII